MPVEKGAQLIVEDILKEARAKAAGIISSAKKEAQTILDAARIGAKEDEGRDLKEARAQGNDVYGELLAEGRMRAKRELLARREELINGIFAAAEKKLRAFASSDKYGEELPRTVAMSCKKLGFDKVTVRANRRDLKLLERSRAQLARELGKTEKDLSISFEGPIEAIGGVIVADPDGKVEIDETYDGKMRREFEALRVKVAKALFEGSK